MNATDKSSAQESSRTLPVCANAIWSEKRTSDISTSNGRHFIVSKVAVILGVPRQYRGRFKERE